MIWATLALLGIPIWLLLGGLGATLVSRHRFQKQEGVVALVYRSAGDEGWPRTVSYGRYLHNVLIVNHGLALLRTSVHVDTLDVGDAAPKRIDDPVAYALQLDDGTAVELAVSRADNPVPVSIEH